MKEKNSLALSGFPYQKRSYKEKTKKFFETCVEAGIQEANYNNRDGLSTASVRTSRKNKLINYNLYNDIVDKKEMDKAINPYGLSISNFPATYRNYPLVNPSINLLCGEERKRIFNPIVTVLSDDAITERLDKIKDMFAQQYVQMVQDTSLDEKEIEKRLTKFEKFAKYGYKDLRERMGTQVLNYLYHTLDLKEEFSRGFKDALIAAEEIYAVEIWGGEPRLRKCNPLNIITVRAGESWKIEDSDIIIEDVWMSRGEVIDRYYDHLTSKDITKIEEGNNEIVNPGSGIFREQLRNNGIEGAIFYDMDDPEVAKFASSYFDAGFDNEGNVRVTKVVWKGLKKLYFIKYIDEFGVEQEEVLSEQYEINKDLGEDITERWVNVWYEGTKIANDIYVKLGQCEFQMRHSDNYSICYPPYVGTVYNVNSSKGRSIIDISKDYQYLWNTFWYKTELAFTKYKGKIGKLNLHLIPDFQDVESALYFAESTGWMLQDKFNESNRGMSKGKLAGAMNEGSDVIDMEMGNYIQHHVNMLRYIKEQVDELIGITPQRRGSIDNRETVGGVERSVMQSSHITEEWFSIHENTRVRAIRLLLEATKVAWKNKGFTREFVLDDGTKALLDFDYDTFAEASYGVDVSNSTNDAQALQAIKALGERLTQAQGGLTLFAETLRAKDFASVYRKIADFEENLAMQQQEQQQAEMQAQQQQVQMEAQLEQERMALEAENKQLDRELKQYEIDTNNETKIYVAELNTYIGAENQDRNNDGIPDAMQISEMAIKERDMSSKEFTQAREQDRKDRELQAKKDMESRKLELEKRKIELEDKKLESARKLQEQKDKSAMEREKLKAKTALKNKVSGEK